METQQPLVSVIIPTRNRSDKLLRCLKSISKSNYPSIEIVVIDDASDRDITSVLAEEFPAVTVIRNDYRRLLSYSRNLGARHSSGDFFFFIDDDNVVSPQGISELVKTFDLESVGVVSPIAYRYDDPNRVWTSYIRKGRFPGFYILGLAEPCGLVDTFSFHNAFMTRRSVFEACGQFDSNAFPIHFSELDFAYRLHANGYRAVVNPRAKVWHDVGMGHMHVDSLRSYYTLRNRIILLRRYASKNELRLYIFGILPFLTTYYLAHHVVNATDHRLSATYNLLRGVMAGLAFRDSRKALKITTPSFGPTPIAIPEPSKELPDDLPLVSVVIPTRNSAETLERCLKSLVTQTYSNIEILVVDNQSNDDTVGIARKFQGVRVFQAGPERSAQVNFGVSVSRGDYVYRVDADFIVEPRVIEEAVSRCKLDGFQVVTVHNTSDPNISFWSRVRKLERDCYEDDTVNIAARFFDKNAFLSTGGFNERLIASEDYDLHNRLVRSGFKIGRTRSKELHIGEPKKLSDVVVKHVFYGKKIEGFIKRNPGISITQLSPLRTAYIRHWKAFADNPELTIGFLLYQYVRYLSALAGYLTTKV